MKDKDFKQYFLENLSDNVYKATINLSDRFLERHLQKSLGYEDYVFAFNLFREFLDQHNVPYSIPKTLKNYRSSNYQTVERIRDFFKEVKNNIQSLELSQQLQFMKKPLSISWLENRSSKTTELPSQSSPNNPIFREKDNRIASLDNIIERDLQHPSYNPSFYTNIQIEKVDMMTSNPGGISQSNTNTGSQGSGQQNSIGDKNRLTMSVEVPPLAEEQLSPQDILKDLVELEQEINGSEIPAEIKEEAITYLNAAKKAIDKDKPNKERAKINLEGVAEELQKATQVAEAGTTLFKKVKPIIVKVAGWLGALAVGSFLGTL